MPEQENTRRHTTVGKALQHEGSVQEHRGERHQYWTNQVQQWRKSGLTQKGYCIKEDISLERFGSWKRRLDMAKQNGARGFVTVPAKTVSSALLTRAALGLVVDERYRVEIHDAFSPSTLEAVLQVLSRV
jgi:hypothetical protein